VTMFVRSILKAGIVIVFEYLFLRVEVRARPQWRNGA